MFGAQESYDQDEICSDCLETPPSFDAVRSLLQYDKFSKRIVMQIKKKTDYGIVETCANLLYRRYSRLFEGVSYIIPVPSHWTRLLSRGNNPPDVIAIKLADLSGIRRKKLLKRIRKTEYQKGKTAKDREANVAGAFACGKVFTGNEKVIVVDDVMTTGATMNECAKALKLAGANAVTCVTIASTPSGQIGSRKT
jgi:ComF family protein